VTAELGLASEMGTRQCNLQVHNFELMFVPFTSRRNDVLSWLGRTSDDKNDKRNDGAPFSDVARITGCVAARHPNGAKEVRSQTLASDMLEMTTVDVTRIMLVEQRARSYGAAACSEYAPLNKDNPIYFAGWRWFKICIYVRLLSFRLHARAEDNRYEMAAPHTSYVIDAGLLCYFFLPARIRVSTHVAE
jgi:hypothetical protein